MLRKILGVSMLIWVGLCCTTTNTIASSRSSIQPLTQIVAIVNDNVITQSEFDMALKATREQYTQHGIPLPESKTFKHQVLENLIYQQLQLQIAKRANITISKAEVDRAMQRIAQQNHTTLNRLKSQLVAYGYTYTGFRQQIHKQLIISKIQAQAVANKIHVTKKQIAQYRKQYQQHSSSYQYHVADLLIPVNDQASKQQWAQAQQRALAIMQKIKQGTGFDQVARVLAGANSANPVGDLGWRNLNELPEVFAKHVTHLAINQINGPIKAPNGYHIIKLLGRRSHTKPLTDNQIKMILSQQQWQKALKAWLKQTRQTAYVNIKVKF